jgi:hypothetical protein
VESPTVKGRITALFSESTHCFVETDDGKLYFANYTSFVEKEWMEVNNGDLVEFNVHHKYPGSNVTWAENVRRTK